MSVLGTLRHLPGAPVQVGQEAWLVRQFTMADVLAFAKLSGDHNPVHVDAAAAARSQFGRCVVHGMLYSSLFSTIFATQVPGCIYLEQSVHFKSPVFVGDAVKAR